MIFLMKKLQMWLIWKVSMGDYGEVNWSILTNRNAGCTDEVNAQEGEYTAFFLYDFEV